MTTRSQRWLALILRVNGLILLLAVPAIFLPFRWMAALHEWLGMGELPALPLVGYLARSVSALYALYGAATLIIASDLKRYAPLVTCWGGACVLAGPVLLGIDLLEPMPRLWTACEGPYLASVGLVVLWLQWTARRDDGAEPK